jgi:hypothetical protein
VASTFTLCEVPERTTGITDVKEGFAIKGVNILKADMPVPDRFAQSSQSRKFGKTYE